ncbi:MAG: AEC family transporter [Negativicutes bacterium]|nr:AEC family transporter [Negativicutes bacterium]MDR3589938.1 AEC family transporter [Negativicutes bacterium]
MAIFFHILGYNIGPIFLLIILGFILGKKFNIDILSLSKLNIYLLMPAFVFYSLYTTNIGLDMLKVLFCCMLLLACNDMIGRMISKIRHHNSGLTNAFKNSIMFNNSGNIGLSLITLVFASTPYVIDGQTPYLHEAITAQIMIMLFQNTTSNTLGFFNAGRAKLNVKDSLRKVLFMPAIYAIPSALLLKNIGFNLHETMVWPVLEYLKNALVPVVLITLGVQLAKTKFDFGNVDVHISVFTRLIMGPILAIIGVYLFGFTGVIAQTLFIAYAVPTAVNTALIAVECDSCPEFASQSVMMSTLFSAVTLTGAIYIARTIFPV